MAPPHLAYIAWGFPPSRSGGAYRQLATANAFAQAGWQVSVITVDRAVFTKITGADLSLESHLDPRVVVRRTKFAWPLRNPDRATWTLPHRLAPRLWRKGRALTELALFPEVGYATWLRPLTMALRAIDHQTPIDLVLASGNPFVSFAAARRFARRRTVPYVLDYRDAWTLDQFTGLTRYGPSSRPGRIERRLIGGAAQVWFVNQATLDWHAARYPLSVDRFRVVANGWDPEFVRFTPVPQPVARPMTFGFLGTISVKVPLAQLLEGWRLAKASGLIPPNALLKVAGYLGYFGQASSPDEDPTAKLLDQAKPDGVEFVGPVPKAQVADYYASLDALVLAIEAGPHVTTGKVFEYVATAKPIVSVHPRQAAASEVLDGYPLWAPAASLTGPAVADALGQAARLIADLTPQQTDTAKAHAAQFKRAAQLAGPIAELATLVGPCPLTDGSAATGSRTVT